MFDNNEAAVVIVYSEAHFNIFKTEKNMKNY